MTVKKYILLLLSFACYAYITQWGIVLYGLLGTFSTISNRLVSTRYGRALSFTSVLSFVLGFALIKTDSTILPVIGYSVFAFSGISFIVDQYKIKKRYSIIDIWLFLFFFPKMLAGPIVRIEDFLSSNNWERISASRLYAGLKIFIYASFLKFIIADIALNTEVKGVGINLLLASAIWGIRFYFDFYAYSLMAVGLGRITGVHLPCNFNNPYGSQTFRTFWQRWNITLTNWLKDYIYIPLGGNKTSKLRAFFNTLITFAISGCWHGLSFPFILWGLIHGILVCVERVFINSLDNIKMIRKIYSTMVIAIITLLWQLFRLQNTNELQEYCLGISQSTSFDPILLIWLGSALAILCCSENKMLKRLVFNMGDSMRFVCYEVTLLALMLMALVLCPNSYSFNFFYLEF